MCGFVVIFHPDGGNYKEKLLNATSAITHRGPDDFGYFHEDQISIGFRRLSIIDLSKNANQPFFSLDGRYVLVFNGEIYNYIELRNLLIAKGYKFKTSSDTEVIINSYIEFKEKCLDYFRGMFSFVIWDRQNKECFFSRDRIGIKPLFIYQHKSKVLVLTSEIKSIISIFPEETKENDNIVFKFMSRNFVDDSDDTFFKNIKQFPKSSFCKLNNSLNIHTKKYWSLETYGTKKFNHEEFKNQFFETIKLHTRSDVPIAATLSGGMDSSSIVGAISKNIKLKDKLKTYTVIPPNTFDESNYINQTVLYNDIEHEYIKINEEKIDDKISEIILMHDEPFQYASCIYQYLLIKKLFEKNHKVLLVGEGGDEVLAGYRRMIFMYLNSIRFSEDSDNYLEILQGAKELLNLDSNQKVLENLDNYNNIISKGLSGQENTQSYDIFNSDSMSKYSEIINESQYFQKKNDHNFSLKKLLKNHILLRNIPFVLRMEDRNSMAFGIESRVPFLDHKFIEYIFSHNEYEFMDRGENKSMLRKAMEKVVHSSIINRKTKTNRPGSQAYLCYNALANNISDMLSSKIIQESSFLKKSLIDIFEKDKINNNIQRAETWFRLYIFFKCKKIYKTY